MNATCNDRIDNELESRLDDLRQLWEAEKNGNEDGVDGLGTFCEYGLAFDYVAPEEEEGEDGEPIESDEPGYFRYQLSWGGPSDEFRFYADGQGYKWNVWKVEYVFMDWFDGAKRTLHGDDRALLEEIFDFFVEVGSAQTEFEKAYDL